VKSVLDVLNDFRKLDQEQREQHQATFDLAVKQFFLKEPTEKESNKEKPDRLNVFFSRLGQLQGALNLRVVSVFEFYASSPKIDDPMLKSIYRVAREALREIFIDEVAKLKQEYESQDFNQQERIKLDVSLTDLLMRFLLAKRANTQHTQFFDVEGQLGLLANWLGDEDCPIEDIQWLNEKFKSFDEKCGDNYCLTLSTHCVEKIKNPPEKIELRKGSLTGCVNNPLLPYSKRLAAATLLDALASGMDNARNARQLGGWIQNMAPFAATGYTAFIFGPELLIAAGAAAALKTPGLLFKGSKNGTLDFIGKQCDDLAGAVFYSTSALLVGAYSLSSRAVNYATLPFSSMLCFLTGSYDDVIFKSTEINNLAIQQVLRPLNDYCEQTSKQSGVAWRQGNTKIALFSAVIAKIEHVDGSDSTPLTKRLTTIKEFLSAALGNKEINQSGYKAIAALNEAILEVDRAQKAHRSKEQAQFYDAYTEALVPIRNYIKQQSLQAASSWRLGASKAQVFEEFIEACNSSPLDNEQLSAEEKFSELEQKLQELVENPIFEQGSNSKQAALEAQSTFKEIRGSAAYTLRAALQSEY
jgi:hypothetical protein